MFLGEIEAGSHQANLTLYAFVSPPSFVAFSSAACNLVLQLLNKRQNDDPTAFPKLCAGNTSSRKC